MEDKETVVKTIRKTFNSPIYAGISWFKFVASVNNIKLSKRELELLGYINYRGTISSVSSKQEFCKIFDSSEGTISNMVSKLLKMKEKLIIKDKNKVKINPVLAVDFSKDFVIRLFINTALNNKENVDRN